MYLIKNFAIHQVPAREERSELKQNHTFSGQLFWSTLR